MGSILCVAEIQDGKVRECTFEVVALAHKIAEATGQEVKGLVVGSGVGDAAQSLASRGCSEVLCADADGFASYTVDAWSQAARAAVETADADVVLFSHTPRGWDVAPRVAARFDAAFASDCFNVQVEGDKPAFVRRVFNGKLDALMSSTGDKIVATVQPGATAAHEGSGDGKVTPLEVKLDGLRARFLETKAAESKGVDLSKAEIIVSGGRGVGAPEKFQEVIQPLVDALGGAMGASRPVVDAGWLPHEYQVGSSGQVVSPKLYIACGISGAIQHLVGMKTSNFIVAINKDGDAPIFEVADLGVVGDLFEVVPALTEAVKTAKGG